MGIYSLLSPPGGRHDLTRHSSPYFAARHAVSPAKTASRRPLSCCPFPSLLPDNSSPFPARYRDESPHPAAHPGLTPAALRPAQAPLPHPWPRPPPLTPPVSQSGLGREGRGRAGSHSQSTREVRRRRGQSAFRFLVGALAAVGATHRAAGPACRRRCRRRSCRGSGCTLAWPCPGVTEDEPPRCPARVPPCPPESIHLATGEGRASGGGAARGRVLPEGSGRRRWAAEGMGRAPGKAAREAEGQPAT